MPPWLMIKPATNVSSHILSCISLLNLSLTFKIQARLLLHRQPYLRTHIHVFVDSRGHSLVSRLNQKKGSNRPKAHSLNLHLSDAIGLIHHQSPSPPSTPTTWILNGRRSACCQVEYLQCFINQHCCCTTPLSLA